MVETGDGGAPCRGVGGSSVVSPRPGISSGSGLSPLWCLVVGFARDPGEK